MSNSRRRGFRLGWWGAAVAHVGSNMVRKSRAANALASAARVTGRSVTRTGRLLWLEVTGLFFVAFAAIGALEAWNEWGKHKVLSGRLLAALCFSVLFAWFGVSSFLRARSKG